MKNSFFKISLKLKLLFALMGVSTAMLITHSIIVFRQFEDDKIAYVFDAMSGQSAGMAHQIREKLRSLADRTDFLLRGFDYNTFSFHPYMSQVFISERNFSTLVVGKYTTNIRKFEVKNSLSKPLKTGTESEELVTKESQYSDAFIHQVIRNQLGVLYNANQNGVWNLGLRYQIPNSDDFLVLVATIEGDSFIQSFEGTQFQDTYLILENGTLLIGPQKPIYPFSTVQLAQIFKAAVSNMFSEREVTEVSVNSEKFLTSSSKVGVGGILTFSFVPRKVALSALYSVLSQSLYFVGFLICLTLVISVVGSNRLTHKLNQLIEVTKKISSGQFNIKVAVESDDEVGILTSGFNHMATEIRRLMLETAEKARMENELNTARTVQSTLFPESHFSNNDIEVAGHYFPASECGGDWWYYNQIGSTYYFWIGDATGHGVSAALVTSAVRAAAGVIEQMPETQLGQVMNYLNKAIYSTAHGKVNMTFFVGKYDVNTYEFSYVNASHDFPYIVPAGRDTITKNDLVPLMDNRGPRLGENKESLYQESKLLMKAGDRIAFYTDGVTELKNSQGKDWGERQFFKCLIDSVQQKEGVSQTVQQIHTRMENFRGLEPLHDDVTYFLIELKQTA
jgi:sigma-B regulation protein RsbU (phosphoserine phosphatase)